MAPSQTSQRPRRCWEVHLGSAFLELLEKRGVLVGPFDEESLCREARRKTGLSDFGDDRFREGLRVALKAFQAEAQANALGRAIAKNAALSCLCNRLKIEEELKQHPEILETPVHRPLIVVGLPRTGTTLLHNLLACDPVSRPLLGWEALRPVGPKQTDGKQPDPRIRQAVRGDWRVKRIIPDLPTIHAVDSRTPEECHMLLRNSFLWSGAMAMPTYREWFLGLSPEMSEWAYGEYRRQLQILQWQRPPKGLWLLKSPVHSWNLDALVKVLPNACLIQIHRDPIKVIPSICSLFAANNGMFSNNVREHLFGPIMVEMGLEQIRRKQQVQKQIEPGQILDLRYNDLVSDPIQTIRNIHEHFGLAYSDTLEANAKKWLAKNPKNKHGKHRYSLERFGLTPDGVNGPFEEYCRRYGIEQADHSA